MDRHFGLFRLYSTGTVKGETHVCEPLFLLSFLRVQLLLPTTAARISSERGRKPAFIDPGFLQAQLKFLLPRPGHLAHETKHILVRARNGIKPLDLAHEPKSPILVDLHDTRTVISRRSIPILLVE